MIDKSIPGSESLGKLASQDTSIMMIMTVMIMMIMMKMMKVVPDDNDDDDDGDAWLLATWSVRTKGLY